MNRCAGLSPGGVGRETVLALAARWGTELREARHRARYARLVWRDHPLCLAVTLCYMNESGQAVAALMRHFGISADRLLAVSDDLDLPLGALRIRPAGGSGGHRGLESIGRHVGTSEFPRLRVGIGRPAEGEDPADYVLARFGDEERPLVDNVIDRALGAIETVVLSGIWTAMVQINRQRDGQPLTTLRGSGTP